MSFDPRWNDARSREVDDATRDIYQDARDRGDDPRDAFLNNVDLPRGRERELVLDRGRTYELHGEESRTLATIGAFRIVSERDLLDSRDESPDARCDALEHLRDEGLVEIVSLDGRERAVVLTDRGLDLLEANRRERDDGRSQEFYAGVNRPREMTHDAQLYRAYRKTEERLKDEGAEIRRVVLEQELKREYQSFLQDGNRGKPDSDGRPDRDEREIARWAQEHELPYFDDKVHFPDFRVEYEIDGRERHEDVEVVTPHYRGAHAVSRARTGFVCFHTRTGGRGGRPFDPRLAEELV